MRKRGNTQPAVQKPQPISGDVPPPKLISEQVVTGQVNVVNGNRLGIQTDTKRVSSVTANPLYEYVAGGSYAWTASYLRTLPFYVDDLSRDFGDDIYDRMMLDAQVAKDVHLLKSSILADGVHFTPAVKEDDPAYKLALQINDFCRRNIDGLVRPGTVETPDDLWYDMLDGIAYGNKLAEQIYEIVDGKLCLRAIKVKPRRSAAYVVDVYQNVVGILGLIPGQGGPIIVESMIGNPGQVPNLLPRRKFCVFAYRPRNGDSRGQSILRAAYDPWWLKQQVKPEWLRYASQFAGPSLWATTPENAHHLPQTDGAGNVLTDSNGNPLYNEPEIAVLSALQTFRNGTVAVFPFGTELHPLEMNGYGAPFQLLIDYCNKEITKAILAQTRATEEADHGSKADSMTAQDIQGIIVRHGKRALESMIRRDVLTNLVEFNFGKDALRLIPKVACSSTEQQDFASDATAVAALQTSGYLDPSQYQEIDAKLGLPRRSDESIQQARQAKIQAMQQPAPAANVPGARPDQRTGAQPAASPQGKDRPATGKAKMAKGGDMPALYLVRHGKTARNGTSDSPDFIRGWDDVPLSDEGRQEARDAADTLKPLGIERLLTSDLSRAKETAQIIGKAIGVPAPLASKDFRPWNLGDFQGKKTTDMLPEMRRLITDAPDDPVPGGESFNSYKQRFLSALRPLLDQMASGKAPTTAIVTHYRCVKLAQAWIDAGATGTDFNQKTMLKDDAPTGSVLKIFQDGDDWDYELIGG